MYIIRLNTEIEIVLLNVQKIATFMFVCCYVLSKSANSYCLSGVYCLKYSKIKFSPECKLQSYVDGFKTLQRLSYGDVF